MPTQESSTVHAGREALIRRSRGRKWAALASMGVAVVSGVTLAAAPDRGRPQAPPTSPAPTETSTPAIPLIPFSTVASAEFVEDVGFDR